MQSRNCFIKSNILETFYKNEARLSQIITPRIKITIRVIIISFFCILPIWLSFLSNESKTFLQKTCEHNFLNVILQEFAMNYGFFGIFRFGKTLLTIHRPGRGISPISVAQLQRSFSQKFHARSTSKNSLVFYERPPKNCLLM